MQNYKPNSHRVISTEDLLKMRSTGTLTPSLKDLLNRRLELEVELAKASNYSKKFKKRCVTYFCGKRIPGNWEHYRQFGNYCEACRTRVNNKPSKKKNPKAEKEFMQMFGGLAN